MSPPKSKPCVPAWREDDEAGGRFPEESASRTLPKGVLVPELIFLPSF